MSWSMDAVRQAWNMRERSRQRQASTALGLPDSGPEAPVPSPMEAAVYKLSSLLSPRFVVEVFNDFIIVEGDYKEGAAAGPRFDGPLFKVPYTVDDTEGSITFGDLTPVEIEYKPKSELSQLHRVLLSNPLPGVDVLFIDDENQRESTLVMTKDMKKLVSITELA